MPFVKRSFVWASLLMTVIFANAYAEQYYVIGNSSNNCTVQWGVRQPFVTGSDCACMRISPLHDDREWVIDLNSLQCYPALQNQDHTKGLKPNDCQPGDGCDQFQCLQLLYEDNEMHPVDQETVVKKQCRIMDAFSHKIVPMPICDAHGNCPTE